MEHFILFYFFSFGKVDLKTNFEKKETTKYK